METILVSFPLLLATLLGQSLVPTPPAQGTKVAVLDFKRAVERNEIAQRVNNRLEKELQPYTEKAKALREELAKLSQDSATNKEAVLRKAAELGALGDEARERFADQYEKEMEAAHKQINAAAKAVAEYYGFSLVLSQGHPVDPFERFDPPRSKRRPVSDSGPAILFAHSSVDITEAVIEIQMEPRPLRLRQDKQSKPTEPDR